MSAVCPACGVAVVPGYAKCPKCHRPLPNAQRVKSAGAGGTVAEDRQFPWMLIAVPLGTVIVIVLLLKLVAGGSDDDPPTTGSAEAPVAASGTTVQPQTPTGTPPPFQPTTPTQPTPQAPDPNAAVTELDRVLRGRRLWSSVEASPPRVDVRSALCDDPGMKPAINAVVPVLRGGGLTRLRCLAQSGTVVFERDL